MRKASIRTPVKKLKKRPIHSNIHEESKKRIREDIPELPFLPNELIMIICDLLYSNATKLLDCLNMSATCKFYRDRLDAVSDDEEKRHIFLYGIQERNFHEPATIYRITVYELSFIIRNFIMERIDKYKEGVYTLLDFSNESPFIEFFFKLNGIELMGNLNIIEPIFQEVLSNVNSYLKHIIHHILVFTKSYKYKIIHKPYRKAQLRDPMMVIPLTL